ncbi:hypothetical protein MTR67_043933 [Solanum verrucosum]|uniref:Uncharacterized protein n=1 Tax=Solanum verrucosum TaxID=315347 RepID=A0AAF0USC9_SOLVR|nr:hypothetical protein MTR67_043933 [Solanum verrucosum]
MLRVGWGCKIKINANNHDNLAINHLFLHCKETVKLWQIFINKRGISWSMPGNIKEALACWNRDGNQSGHRERWKIVPACIWWTIWLERNQRCFENKSCSMEKMKLKCLALFYFWCKHEYPHEDEDITSMYIDIAKYGFFALENYGDRDTKLSDQKEPQTSQNTVHREKPTDLEGVMISIAEQLYSVLLLTFFFMEVYVTGFIPYIGKALNFMLLSWLYAYYCFEYKWNLSGLSLDKRLDFFESNWAFFAGFGNPCVLAIFLFSPLVSCGVMAMLFPLVNTSSNFCDFLSSSFAYNKVSMVMIKIEVMSAKSLCALPLTGKGIRNGNFEELLENYQHRKKVHPKLLLIVLVEGP